MSVPMCLDEPRRLRPAERVAAHVAVAVARVLSRLPPRRIRAVFRLLRRGAAPADHPRVLEARQAVVAVSLRCAGYCLPRSVAVALLCRLHGSWPTWQVGVRTEPFRAHAWVEADGQPVGEVPGFNGFTVIISVPPDGRSAPARSRMEPAA
jgi:Transglutaminase-like superfamily